jgi:hypothetical protein
MRFIIKFHVDSSLSWADIFKKFAVFFGRMKRASVSALDLCVVSHPFMRIEATKVVFR